MTSMCVCERERDGEIPYSAAIQHLIAVYSN